nr:hypothetical protein [Tanacetum cinerariifolium]
MSFAFVDTHNIVAILTKSDASEGFDQIIDFLNGIYIQYALTMNPHIYVSCIKQFWTTVTIKQSTDITRLQALVDRKKVVLSEAVIQDVLRLDDAEGVDCLLNKELFTGLARMGVGKGFSGVETPLFEGNGYHDVPTPYSGTFMPPKPDLAFNNAPNDVETVHTAFNVKLNPTKPAQDLSHTNRPLAPIIEDWVSDSDDESE